MPLLNNLSNAFAQLPQRKITQVIILLLLSYIAYMFAQITWLVIPQPSNISQVQVNGSHKTTLSAPKKLNINALESLNLFGVFSEQETDKIEETVVEDAPETNLRLTLTGVGASSDKASAAAIIESSGRQEVYSIGESIKGTRAVLENVFKDRVLLKVSGKLETLMLDGVDFNGKKSSAKKSKFFPSKQKIIQPRSANRIDQRKNKTLIKRTDSVKKKLDADPSKITDYLKISPKRRRGKIVGYLLHPGKNSTFFDKAGLKSGDIAIKMNSFDLTQSTEAAQALQSLKTEREVSLLLDRDGDITEILFSIDN